MEELLAEVWSPAFQAEVERVRADIVASGARQDQLAAELRDALAWAEVLRKHLEETD